MRNSRMLAPDFARLAIELYKHPQLEYLDLSMDFLPFSNEGDTSRDPQICNRGAKGFRRNFIGFGVEGVESLSVFLTVTTTLRKLRYALSRPHAGTGEQRAVHRRVACLRACLLV
jgi:hypothetical protein